MVGVGGDLGVIWFQAPCHGQRSLTLDQVALMEGVIMSFHYLSKSDLFPNRLAFLLHGCTVFSMADFSYYY